MRNRWSLQDVANRTGINKAYLSEFENGKREFPADTRDRLRLALLEQPAGHAIPELREWQGKRRLVLLDPETGAVLDVPPIAHVSWTDASGMAYTIYVGDPAL